MSGHCQRGRRRLSQGSATQGWYRAPHSLLLCLHFHSGEWSQLQMWRQTALSHVIMGPVSWTYSPNSGLTVLCVLSTRGKSALVRSPWDNSRWLFEILVYKINKLNVTVCNLIPWKFQQQNSHIHKAIIYESPLDRLPWCLTAATLFQVPRLPLEMQDQ